MKRLNSSVAMLTLLVSGIAGTATAEVLTYSLQDLGTLSGGVGWTVPFAVNNNGQVVGYSFNGTEAHAFRWYNGTMTDLGVLREGDNFSEACDINDSGLAVGWSTPWGEGNWDNRAVAFENNAVTALPTLGGNYGLARGVNSYGDIVGISALASGVTHAFLLSDGVITDIDNIAAGNTDFSDAYDINDHGQVVGDYVKNMTVDRAFIWEEGVGMTDLGALAGMTQSRAYKVNELGQVVGESFNVAAPGEYSSGHAYLWNNDTMTDLGVLAGKTYSLAYSLNDSGMVVGTSYSDPRNEKTWLATMWNADGTMYDLNDLVDASADDWVLLEAGEKRLPHFRSPG